MTKDVSQRRVRVLHLEDNDNDHLLVAEILASDGLSCEFVVAKSEGEFFQALRAGKYDFILSDYTLPSYNGLSALALAQQLHPETPFVFFSGTIGEEVAVDSLKNGASDYVLKQRPSRLAPAIRLALQNAQERLRLRQAEEKIREQVDLLDKARDAILLCGLDNRIVFWNQSAERIYGWTASEVIGRDVAEVFFRGASPQFEEAIKSVAEQGEWVGEMQHFTKDGEIVTVQSRCTLIRNELGQPKSRLMLNTDITERKQLEEQFLRVQRLESLGVLASGIAHDLNNALTPIVIGIGILRQEESLPAQLESILNTMENSARSGVDMVKQVLAFARGSDGEKVMINIGQLVNNMGKIVADTFPKNIDCRMNVDRASWSISGLPTQLNQVLMNLCVNARDAMPEGGTLSLTTQNISLNAAEAEMHLQAKPGNYLCISVSDTGVGIPLERIEKIFEPFFTTKAPDKGTGLGLSTSLTIIRNHGGFVTVHSQVGRGTEFKCYLPAVTGSAPEGAMQQKPKLPAGNGECILVVDDEEAVLAITQTALQHYGYHVLTASSGPEAVACLTEKGEAVRLVMTDLSMPFMDGYATIAALRKIRPELKIIISSGLEREKEEANDQEVKIDAVISKPFTTENLLITVHDVLTNKP